MLASLAIKPTDRKLGLFARACCREIWDTSPEAGTRLALALAEHVAETNGARSARVEIRIPAGKAVIDWGASEPLESLEAAGGDGPPTSIRPSELPVPLNYVLEHLTCRRFSSWQMDWLARAFAAAGLAFPRQADLFRDVVYGHFRPLFFRDVWRKRNDGVAMKVAQAIYQEQTFRELPILADALEDAGCDELALLQHLRGDGPHVRGCWVVDLILKKG
jgi:hypothetical protein